MSYLANFINEALISVMDFPRGTISQYYSLFEYTVSPVLICIIQTLFIRLKNYSKGKFVYLITINSVFLLSLIKFCNERYANVIRTVDCVSYIFSENMFLAPRFHHCWFHSLKHCGKFSKLNILYEKRNVFRNGLVIPQIVFLPFCSSFHLSGIFETANVRIVSLNSTIREGSEIGTVL